MAYRNSNVSFKQMIPQFMSEQYRTTDGSRGVNQNSDPNILQEIQEQRKAA